MEVGSHYSFKQMVVVDVCFDLMKIVIWPALGGCI
jgi:hypothetical protein